MSAPAAEVIPHAQDKPPGPPLSPAEAMQKMTVPAGLHGRAGRQRAGHRQSGGHDVRRAGPDLDHREPRVSALEAGPGRDRIKVLEDTDGDGTADKFTIFAEGLNIPSGIAVGHGGVWVANAPDILFLQDTDGDGKADKQEVVVTGFGRDDTHELPNSLTWGPDGWLYGLNGVFNRSHVEHSGKQFDFTCALFRIHPRTREFRALLPKGTSNPWGVAWDTEGSAFVSACVIDHLWHLAETGYYLRQGGPYPPFTWPIGSIVKHKHQKAAYCGIHYFDSDAYPPEYRERLYMGNIHGSCINVDVLARDGSTYVGTPAPTFSRPTTPGSCRSCRRPAPTAACTFSTGTTGTTAIRTPAAIRAGIDRLKGRLYRVRYRETRRAPAVRSGHGDRRATDRAACTARTSTSATSPSGILSRAERSAKRGRSSSGWSRDESAPRKARMHALWALVGGGPLAAEFHLALLEPRRPGLSRLGRARGRQPADASTRRCRDKVVSMTRRSRGRRAAASGDRRPQARWASTRCRSCSTCWSRSGDDQADSARRLAKPASAAGRAGRAVSCS